MNSLITRRSPSSSNSPLASLLSFSRDFDRLFEGPVGLRSVESAFAPAMELREDVDNVTVTVELPGVDKKDVSVTIHDGVLTISGERKQADCGVSPDAATVLLDWAASVQHQPSHLPTDR